MPRATLTLLLIASFSGLGACARSVSIPVREAGPVIRGTGSGAEVVFQGVGAADSAGSDPALLARRDAALTLRPVEPEVDAGWSSPTRPSLSRARRLDLNTRTTDSVIYFERSDSPRGRWYWP